MQRGVSIAGTDSASARTWGLGCAQLSHGYQMQARAWTRSVGVALDALPPLPVPCPAAVAGEVTVETSQDAAPVTAALLSCGPWRLRRDRGAWSGTGRARAASPSGPAQTRTVSRWLMAAK